MKDGFGNLWEKTAFVKLWPYGYW